MDRSSHAIRAPSKQIKGSAPAIDKKAFRDGAVFLILLGLECDGVNILPREECVEGAQDYFYYIMGEMKQLWKKESWLKSSRQKRFYIYKEEAAELICRPFFKVSVIEKNVTP
jgi:hypothetical protein